MGKNKHSKKKSAPQKGDPNYLTPTQLRNRRKKRAKQQGKTFTGDASAAASVVEGVKNVGGKSPSKKDPSMKYIANPMKAPLVQAAKQYFKSITSSDFPVHLGPLYEWRTVSKLAVRPADDDTKEVAIGLFLPQSHKLLPVPNCRAHHPSINLAVECITKACHEVGVVPYEEHGKVKAVAEDDSSNGGSGGAVSDLKDNVERGTGQLRYVAINVARDTGAAQITLVWNTPPPDIDGGEGEGKKKRKHDVTVDGDTVLEKLVAKLISMSNNNGNNINSNSSTNKDEKDGVSTTEDEPKKRRRRGRREGSDTQTTDITTIGKKSNNPDIASNKTSSHTTSKNSQGNPLKLNLHSLWINYNPSWKHSNAIFAFDSTCWRHVHGPSAIIEHLKFENDGAVLANPKPPSFPIPLNFPPNVFRQANLDAFTNIVGRIRERIQKLGEDATDDKISCVELYGGVGTIGLHLSDVVSSLVSSDENPNNSTCFYDSVRSLPADVQSRLVYRQKNAADMVTSESAMFQQSNVLIVDPPRKGLDDEVVDYLCKSGYKTMKLVVYVSCGFQAFQRDCNTLVQSGKWKVEFAEGYLLFPGADAIETLAFFVPV